MNSSIPNSISVLDNRDLLGFTMKATHPEHRVKVQVLFRCRTQDPCSWVRGRGGGRAKKGKEEAGAELPMSMETGGRGKGRG